MVSLLKACQEGDLARVDALLLDSLQDIEIKDHNGFTPLILAVKGGHSTIVQALLNRGANPTNASPQGRPETYSTDPYILQLLAIARGEMSLYHPQTMHAQYYSYPPYYSYVVQDSSWYLPHHHPQHITTQQEHPQPDHADSTSNAVVTPNNITPCPSSIVSAHQQSSLPPPDVARNIPCRYFPACRYGSSCLFSHHPTPYLSGPLPPPAHYPHLCYLPLTHSLRDSAAVSTGSSLSPPVDPADQSSTQPFFVDPNMKKGDVNMSQNATATSSPSSPADAQSESGVLVFGGESGAQASLAAAGTIAEGSDHTRSPTSPAFHMHSGVVYMCPQTPQTPHYSQDGPQMFTLPPASALARHYYPLPVPGAALPPHHLSQHQSTLPLPPLPSQHLIAVSQEIPLDQRQQSQYKQQSRHDHLLLENQGQQPQLPTIQSHALPYPPPHIYSTTFHTTHATWPISPLPLPPPQQQQPQLHSGVHPYPPVHPCVSVPPSLSALTPGMSIHSVHVAGSARSLSSNSFNGPGSFGLRVGGPVRGSRRAFRNDRERVGDKDIDRGECVDRDRDRDCDRGDRFNSAPNGHYHHGGSHSSKKALCLFFPNGKCRNGHECRFSHVLPGTNEDVFLPYASVPNHRHAQFVSYRQSNYVNGQSFDAISLVNGVNSIGVNGGGGEVQSSATVNAGIGTGTTDGLNKTAGTMSSGPTVDEILNAMSLDSTQPSGTGRRQHLGGGRRGKHYGPHAQGGGGYSPSHGHGSGHPHRRSTPASPLSGGQQQEQQRVPTADDFPVLGGGTSTNEGASSAGTTIGRTTPTHTNFGGTSHVVGRSITTANTPASEAVTSATADATPTCHIVPNGWGISLVNGGAMRPTAAQVVKEGTSNNHGYVGA